MIKPYDRELLRRQYSSAKPFPYIIIENFLEPDAAQEVARSYPSFADAIKQGYTFKAVNEQRKVQVTDSSRFPPPVARLNDVLASQKFLDDLSYITGIPKLLADEQLSGGGMHVTGPGGRLDVHVDFNYFEDRQIHRRLNILVYMNPEWHDDWGGEIELWDKDVKNCAERLKPILNRCLIFQTTGFSYHGVRPITAPGGVERKSFAAYYYTKEPPPDWKGEVHSTIFKARPDEKLRGMVLMPAERLMRGVMTKARQFKSRIRRTLGGSADS
jgi:Rps23 Pro-64 3,4-dihydroxylase Tpa1-like proline 4-hydroxylase